MILLDRFTSTSKINLYLDIVGKDPVDGYHFIESIFYEIPWGDDFSVFSAKKDSVVFENISLQEITLENTVSKALSLFKEKFCITECFHFSIIKNVPIGAGIGGGSGDAGAVLKWLATRFNINKKECIDIAQKIGSDVPFFLYGGMALVEGKGELITPLNNQLAPDIHLLVFYPNINSSTKQAFDILAQSNYKSMREFKKDIFSKKNVLSIDNIKELVYNIFNEKLEDVHPTLFKIQKELKGKLSPDIIMLTGSGSSFFLFYKTSKGVLKAKELIEQHYKCSKYFTQSI